MKIKIISDLHLEIVSEFSIKELGQRVARTPADVLLLAGDICPLKSKRWKTFLEACDSAFKRIIWVPGNHEYYGSNINFATTNHRRRLAEWNKSLETGRSPVTFLNNATHEYENVNFIGSTLWTDFDKRNPTVMAHVQQYMNDFYRIKVGSRPMVPFDQVTLHEKAKCFIFNEVRKGTLMDKKNVVITHHGPSWLSVAEKYKQDQFSLLFNGAFVSALDEAIMTHDIALWAHGHTHVNFDYMIENTQVVVNPHGYRDENVWGFDPDRIYEV